jgi:hypothetical protein
LVTVLDKQPLLAAITSLLGSVLVDSIPLATIITSLVDMLGSATLLAATTTS